MSATPFRRTDSGIVVSVRLTPNAKKTGIAGVVPQGDDSVALKASVTAAPERGKAIAALIALLAKAWQLPKSTLRVVSGATDRRKQVAVTGDPDSLQRTFDDWMAKHHD